MLQKNEVNKHKNMYIYKMRPIRYKKHIKMRYKHK